MGHYSSECDKVQIDNENSLAQNDDKNERISDEDLDRSDIMAPIYRDMNVLRHVEEETQSKISSDDDYTKEHTSDDGEESTLSKDSDYERVSFLHHNVLRYS